MAFGFPSFATVLNPFAFVLVYKMCQLTEHSLYNPIVVRGVPQIVLPRQPREVANALFSWK